MTGHIKLGAIEDVTLRDYALVDIKRYQCSSANPYAARVSTGGPYAELDTFNNLTVRNWSTGVGNNDPEQGQLFSIGETRFPSYLMPGPHFDFPLTKDTVFQDTAASTSQVQFIPYSTKYYANSFTAPVTDTVTYMWIYMSLPYGYTATVQIRTDDGTGKPSSTVVKTTTVTSDQIRPHAHWMRVIWSGGASLTASTRYHVVVYTNIAAAFSTGVYPYMPSCVTSGSEKCHSSTDSGSTWALEGAGTQGFMFLLAHTESTSIKGIFTWGSAVYCWTSSGLMKSVSGQLQAQLAPASLYHAYQVDNYIYVAAGTDYYRYNMSTDTYDTYTGIPAYMFLLYGGYLWRSTLTSVAYTADETVWSVLDAFTNEVTGMAGMGDTIYCADRDGLYMVTPGDYVIQVAQWPESEDANGEGMCTFEGALYIPVVGGGLMRFDSSGALINVGMNAREDLPKDIRGKIKTLYPTGYFLLAHVAAYEPLGYPSLWAYNVDGWHCLAIGPQNAGPVSGRGAIYIDRENNRLYWGMYHGLLLRTPYPPHVNNPVKILSELEFARDSWVEYDKFYAGYRTLDKDFDSIYIDTENWGKNVHVYWRDSTHDGDYYVAAGQTGWIYLGTVPSSGVYKITFPNALRPAGPWIKLGFRVTTVDATNTGIPVLRGFALKYSTNITDRWRWVLPIAVHNNQQMPDGTINDYTAAQQIAHLDALIAETPPLQYQDVDGTAYLVRVTSASRQVDRYVYEKGTPGGADIQYIYVLTLEEVA